MAPLGGGNKVRKLEYMFAAASHEGTKKTLFTIGPTGSNHVRATAIYGKASEFRVECLLFKQPPTAYSETNYRTICEHATAVHEVDRMTTMFARYAYEQLKTAFGIGEERYFIPAGGSSPLGSVGYVKAVSELKSQIEEGILPEPRFIFVPVGTCGTMAGLVLGGPGCRVEIPCRRHPRRRSSGRKHVGNLTDGQTNPSSYRRGGFK